MTKYWETTTLKDLTPSEWESLCDGCGKCCVHKFFDEQTNNVLFTSVACELFDPLTCQCSDYQNRLSKVSHCLKIKLENPDVFNWLPESCAYKLRFEGKPLPDWHHLVSGDKDLVHSEGHSAQGRVILEEDLEPHESIEDFIIHDA